MDISYDEEADEDQPYEVDNITTSHQICQDCWEIGEEYAKKMASKKKPKGGKS